MVTPSRAHALIEAAQPWYSLGIVFLSLGLMIHIFVRPVILTGADVTEVGAGFFVGLGLSLLGAAMWKQGRAWREGQG